MMKHVFLLVKSTFLFYGKKKNNMVKFFENYFDVETIQVFCDLESRVVKQIIYLATKFIGTTLSTNLIHF